jgi:hypothetical protein
MPSARRLPITAVAHASSTAIVPQRRRGHNSPAGAKLVHEQLAQAQDIPPFLRKHWQKETGFAFPSGL